MAKETLVNKNDTFEDWRQKSNDVSLDLGAVASDNAYTAKSLDTESRLTDQYISKDDLGDGGIYVRDVSSLPNGMEIDYSPGRTVDNTDGYIILKDGADTSEFLAGDGIAQYEGDVFDTTVIFQATIVSVTDKKILVENVSGTGFDASKIIYNVNASSKNIAASKLKELIVESYNYGNVRVYRTRNYSFNATTIVSSKIILPTAAYNAISHNDIIVYTAPSSGGIYGSANSVTTFYVKKDSADAATKKIQLGLSSTSGAVALTAGTGTQTLSTNRVALPQDMSAKGFHIARHAYYATHNASSIPVTFVEGEVLYQGTSGSPTFQGTLLTADIGGVLIFKNILSGTYDHTEDLISTTVVNGAGTTLSGNTIKIANANLTNVLQGAAGNYAQMIEFNSPGVAGDDYKVYFGSAVDAVLELQDDVGTVENLETNADTDLTVAVNELELAIRGTSNALVGDDLPDAGTMTATNVVSALLEHEADLFGAEGVSTKRTLADLGTTDKASIVDAINELETAIRGNGSNLVFTDLGTSRPAASSAGNLLDAVEELYEDIGDVTSTNLGTKQGTHSVITPKIKALDTFLGDTTLTENNNVDLVATPTVTDTLAKLIALIGTATDWKQVGITNQTIGATQGSAGITVTLSAANPAIKIGQAVTGTDIPASTTVANINGTTLTLSQASGGALLADATLTFTEAETLVNAIEFIHREIGDVKALNDDDLGSTTDKPGDLTAAINAIKSFIGTNTIHNIDNGTANTITSALDQLYTDIGDIGDGGANLAAATGFSATNLKSAVVELQGDMGNVTEIDDADGYSGATAVAGIKEIQTYLGDVRTLSNSGDTYTVTAASGHDGTGVNVLTLTSAPDSAVDVGYEVKMTDNGTEIPANTKVIKVNTARTEFTLNNSITIDAGTDANVTFTEPSGYGFANDIVTDSLIAIRTALVGGTADLDDKIATLDDSDGADTDFAATNIVDAIREIQDDLGQQGDLTTAPFHVDLHGSYSRATFQSAINSITAAVGNTDIGGAINTGNETITNAIAQLYTDIGDVGTSGGNLTTTATDLKNAINEHETDIGNMTFTGLEASNISAALRELRTDIGNVTNANLGTNILQTITKNTEANITAGSQKDIILDNVTDIVTGMPVSGHGSIPTNAYVEIISGTTITLSENLTGTIPADTDLTFNVVDITTKVKGLDGAIGDITDIDDATGYSAATVVTGITEIQGKIGDVAGINNATGYTATTAVGGITEIQGKIGEVTAANLGTTSSTLVTAIKEIIDGTGADSVTVATVGNQSRTGKLDKVSGTTVVNIDTHGTATASAQKNITLVDASSVVVGAVVSGHGSIPTGAYVESISTNTITLSENLTGTIPADEELTFTMDQTIIGNIHFNAPHTTEAAKSTTFTFGPNTTLDISAGTLITEGANADFETTAKKIVLKSSINTGQGLKIDRGAVPITSSIVNGSDAEFLWVDNKVTAQDPDLGHNQSDLAWQITGFGYNGPHLNTVTGTNGTGTVTSVQRPNVDFYNAYRLFGIGTTNSSSTQDNISVTWDSVNQNFDISLNDTGTDLTGNTWGTTAKVPQLSIDRQGRITGVTEVAIVDALGEFTLQADGGATGQQTIGVNEIVKIAGTTNEIETSIASSGSPATNTITVGLPNNVTIGNQLSVTGDFNINTDKFTVDATTGDTNIGGNLSVDGSITGSAGSSFSFSSTSTTISSGQLILNALAADETSDTALNETLMQAYIPAAAFVAHRGFKTADVSGDNNTLTKGKRYRIELKNSHTPTAGEQAALKVIAGLATDAEAFVNNDIITAATKGDSVIGSETDIVLHEQKPEAKIAWNESDDRWDLYKGSDTSAGYLITDADLPTLADILFQGATIGTSTNYTSTETDQLERTTHGTETGVNSSTVTVTNPDGIVAGSTIRGTGIADGTIIDNISGNDLTLSKNTTDAVPASTTLQIGKHYPVLFSGNANAMSTVDKLRSDNGFYYNADLNALTLAGGNSKIIAEGGTSLLGGLEVDSLLVGKDATAATTAATARLQGYHAQLALKEHASSIELSNNSNITNPDWTLIANGGSLEARLNNATANRPIQINTNTNRNSITDVVLTAVDGIKFKNNDASTGADTLSHTVNTTKTNASFIGRTDYGDPTLFNNLHIQDVRITGESADTQTAANASKRIQHSVGSSPYNFIDFQGDGGGHNELRLGGYYNSTVKKFFKGNVNGSTELYHNTDNNNASALTLKTVNNGMRYYGTIITNFDEPVTRYSGGGTSVFKGATPVADLQGPLDESTGVDQATHVVIRNGSHHNSVADRTVGLTLTAGPARNSAGTDIDNINNHKKGVDLYIKSTEGYAHNPDFFIDRSDGNKRLLINHEGDIGFYNQPVSGSQIVKFKWDASKARLGVGTDTPLADLHVTSGVGANGSCKLLVQADSTNDGSFEESVPIIELNSDGQTSIGRFYNTGSAIDAQNKLVNSTVISRFGHPGALETGNALQFATGGSANTGAPADDIARMTITHSGKVGINTTAPSEQFEVDGAARIGEALITAGGNIQVGLVTDPDGGAQRVTGYIQVADILPGEKYTQASGGANYDKTALRLWAGESYNTYKTAYDQTIADRLAGGSLESSNFRQEQERVFISAESGLEVNSSVDNWNHVEFKGEAATQGDTFIILNDIRDAETILTGQNVSHASIPADTTVTSVVDKQVNLSNALTANIAANEKILFSGGKTAKQRWDQRNRTVISDKRGDSQFGGKVSHQGLTLTSGREIDQIYSTGGQVIGSTDYDSDWVDVPNVEGNALEAGSYIIQLYVHEATGGVWYEYYTGVMSWWNGTGTNTNDNNSDEILLHNAGHASEEDLGKGWFLRTTRTAAPDGKVKLQIRTDHNAVDSGTYTIKLRRML